MPVSLVVVSCRGTFWSECSHTRTSEAGGHFLDAFMAIIYIYSRQSSHPSTLPPIYLSCELPTHPPIHLSLVHLFIYSSIQLIHTSNNLFIQNGYTQLGFYQTVNHRASKSSCEISSTKSRPTVKGRNSCQGARRRPEIIRRAALTKKGTQRPEGTNTAPPNH